MTWAAAEHGEALALYMIQASDHAGGPWATVAPLSGDATRWVHPNLPKSGATKYYRIRAHNRSSYSGVVPWDPDAAYFTQGSGRSAAVRLDAAYDIRVCQLTEAQLEAKHAEGKPEGTWCVGHRTGQLRVPAGE